jgi:hypothetical protein
MPASAAKQPGDPVLLRRKSGDSSTIEEDWRFVRFEPDSGDLIAEKEGKRVVCSRGECEALNFPGSGDVWQLICSEPDDQNLQGARCAWAELNLSKLVTCLLRHGRALDPALESCQTPTEFAEKVNAIAEVCENSLALLRLELKRAEAEYNRCPTETSFQNDQKDDLLDRWRGLQDRFAARAYRRNKLIPAWQRLAACLEAVQMAKQK